MKTFQERLKEFCDYKGLSYRSFELEIGLSNGCADGLKENSREKTFNRISNAFPELNIDWLRYGKGEMIKDLEFINSPIQNSNIASNGSSISVNGTKAKSMSEISILREQLRQKDEQLKQKDEQIRQKDDQIKMLLEIIAKK